MGGAVFQELREAPLHLLTPAEWEGWYPRMAAFLDDPDPTVREGAVERLMMAAFRAERWPEGRDHQDAADAARRHRAAWLLATVEGAHARHPDLIPFLLRGLRWHGDDEPFPAVLLPWLRALKDRPAPGALPNALVEGAQLLVGGLPWDGPGLPALLDHPSDWVRGCAAYCFGRQDFGGGGRDLLSPAVLAALTEKELARPGIAGPFWSGLGVFGDEPLGFDPLAWMLGIVERRSGPEPAGLPFNGIDFHVHELAAGHPEAIGRLQQAGRLDLALEAALELRGPAEGMAPVLRELSAHPDPAVAHAACVHLARYHGELAPGADPDRLRHQVGWRPGADLFVIRWGDPGAWSSTAVLFPAGRASFDDAEAWSLVDAVLPPMLRGAPARHPIASAQDGTGPARMRGAEMQRYASGAEVALDGNTDARRWSRIEISGGQLRDRWQPLAEAPRGNAATGLSRKAEGDA